jgi:hypothetical protein
MNIRIGIRPGCQQGSIFYRKNAVLNAWLVVTQFENELAKWLETCGYQ